jgi:hypothetical protein
MKPKPKPDPMREIKTLTVRIRNDDQPYGCGTGIKFTADEPENEEPKTALDKLADWIILTCA